VPTKHEKDDITGIETTGHEWDGIKELNNPLPRWWLWTFYACILFALVYWVLYPSWPTLSGYSKGLLGYSRHADLADEVSAARSRQAAYLNGIEAASPAEILADTDLREFAVSGGRSAFAMHCSQCHGAGAEGGVGYPNLNDDEWVWGGSLEDIHTTISYGIRADHEDSRENDMPAFLLDEMMTAGEIAEVAGYVDSLSDGGADVAAAPGAALFEENCASCHGGEGEGITELGAPALNNHIWLYGGDEEALIATISNARSGVMPAWTGRLDEVTLKQLTVFVHSLGGGE